MPRRRCSRTPSRTSSWGNQIRSYVLDQSRIKDLRTGVEIGNTDGGARRRPRPVPGSQPEGRALSCRTDTHHERTDSTQQDENKLIAERRAKLDALRASRAVPFPNDFRRDALAGGAAARLRRARPRAARGATRCACTVAGRMMAKRVMGKASFAKIADRSGQIQLFLQRDALGEAYEAFKGWDIGDILGAEGALFRTQTGELSVQRRAACGCWPSRCGRCPTSGTASPTPSTRYRQRYVDLIMNDASRAGVPQAHARSCAACATSSTRRDFIEVETPMMQPIPGGAAARPFVTHHNALDMQMYLRIAPELYLKRLVVGGFERVYEINRNFRNEGLSTRHNPEFTMLEFYQAYADYRDLMDLIERLLRGLADARAPARAQVELPGRATTIWRAPFRRVTRRGARSCSYNPGFDARDACATCEYLRGVVRAARHRRSSPATAPASCRSRSSRRPASTRLLRADLRHRLSGRGLAAGAAQRRRSVPHRPLRVLHRRARAGQRLLRAERPRGPGGALPRAGRRARRPATTRRCTTTPTTSARWSTACRRPRASASASTGW